MKVSISETSLLNIYLCILKSKNFEVKFHLSFSKKCLLRPKTVEIEISSLSSMASSSIAWECALNPKLLSLPKHYCGTEEKRDNIPMDTNWPECQSDCCFEVEKRNTARQCSTSILLPLPVISIILSPLPPSALKNPGSYNSNLF